MHIRQARHQIFSGAFYNMLAIFRSRRTCISNSHNPIAVNENIFVWLEGRSLLSSDHIHIMNAIIILLREQLLGNQKRNNNEECEFVFIHLGKTIERGQSYKRKEKDLELRRIKVILFYPKKLAEFATKLCPDMS